jgi:hypothetical protein
MYSLSKKTKLILFQSLNTLISETGYSSTGNLCKKLYSGFLINKNASEQ